jgi:hypothetical protein
VKHERFVPKTEKQFISTHPGRHAGSQEDSGDH